MIISNGSYAKEITIFISTLISIPSSTSLTFIFCHISLDPQPTVRLLIQPQLQSVQTGSCCLMLLAVFRFSGHSLKIYVSLGLCHSCSLHLCRYLCLCLRLCLCRGTTDVPFAFAIAASAS